MSADDWTIRQSTGRPVDAWAMTAPLWMDLRRRTSDGYTRVEVTTGSEVRMLNTYGECRFVVYLTDDERRAMARALLEGLA